MKKYYILLLLISLVTPVFSSASPEGYMNEAAIPLGSVKEEIFEIYPANQNDRVYTGIGINRYSNSGNLIETELILKNGFQKITYEFESGQIQKIINITTEEDIIVAPYYIDFAYEDGLLYNVERFYYDEASVDTRVEEFYLRDFAYFNPFWCEKIEFQYNENGQIHTVLFSSNPLETGEEVLSVSRYFYEQELLSEVLFIPNATNQSYEDIFTNYQNDRNQFHNTFEIDRDFKIARFYYNETSIDFYDYLDIDFENYETANICVNYIFLYKDGRLFREYYFEKGFHWAEDPTFCMINEYNRNTEIVVSEVHSITDFLSDELNVTIWNNEYSNYDELGNWRERRLINESDDSWNKTIRRTLTYY